MTRRGNGSLGRFPARSVAMVATILTAAGWVAIAGCASRAQVAPKDFEVIRSYGFDAGVDPQPSWSPESYRIVARDAGGFVVLQEVDGNKGRQKFTSSEKRETHHPVWINEQEVVFGPKANAERVPDGRVVPASDGLTVVTIGGLKPEQKLLTKVGYRPRVGQAHVFAQVEDRMDKIDEHGDIEDFGQGFFAEPQWTGEGVCWQETPVTEPDWWTGKPVRSNLVIRWNWRRTDVVPGGIQPRWTYDGGVVATVLRAEPGPGAAWDQGGTDVVFVGGPRQAPVVIARDAREPAPHPTKSVIAVATADNRIVLVSRDGSQRADIAAGRRPQWSFDGTRLLVEHVPEPAAAAAIPSMRPDDRERSAQGREGNVQAKRLTIYVLRIGPGTK
ncbi:MAG: hypothetical protein H0V44_01770 [Planctomycetes bacterium]|nr:hypothetical protein [Planctomycetota bacterium]